MIITRSISNTICVPGTTKGVSFRFDLDKIPTYIGISTTRGMRPCNEDRMGLAILDNKYYVTNYINSNSITKKDNPIFAFGIWDGHGGVQCSDFLKDNLFKNFETIINDNTVNGQYKDLTVDKDIQNLKAYWFSVGGYWKRWCKKLKPPMSTVDWGQLRYAAWLAHLKCDEFYLKWEKEFNDEAKLNISKEQEKNNDKDSSDRHMHINKSKGKDKNPVHAGSTSTTLLLQPLNSDLYVSPHAVSRLLISHLGDTRAILCDKNGLAHSLTRDHHPNNPIEARRLRGWGLIGMDSFGEERFGSYANTRAVGDWSGKRDGITAEVEMVDILLGNKNDVMKLIPKDKRLKEIVGVDNYTGSHNNHSDLVHAVLNNEDNHNSNDKLISGSSKGDSDSVLYFGGQESFLVLTSDGITNNLNDQEIADLIMTTYNNLGVKRGSPQRCADEVTAFIDCIGGDDNASCMVIRLNGWGKWPVIDRTGSLREAKLENVFKKR